MREPVEQAQGVRSAVSFLLWQGRVRGHGGEFLDSPLAPRRQVQVGEVDVVGHDGADELAVDLLLEGVPGEVDVLLEAAGKGAGALTGGVGSQAGAGAGASAAARAASEAMMLAGAKDVPLTVPDDPCRVMLSATGLVARTQGAEPVPRTGGRQSHDALTSQVPATARGAVGAVTDTGRLVRLDVVAAPEVPRLEGSPSLAGGTPAF